MMGLNLHAVRAIYMFEMNRAFRTWAQSIIAPVLSTSLYFIVFGSAIGSRMGDIGGVSYGAYIIPGLLMLSLLSESISNAAFGIYMPKWSGTIYELLSAPVNWVEVLLGYVGAAASKSLLLGVLILLTARAFVPYEIAHPVWMVGFLLLTAITFCLFGFIIGLWADSFQKLQVIPLLVITPLTFLGGAFYSISMLPEPWQTVSLFNPVVYLISGLRWAFYGAADVHIGISTGMTLMFMFACLGVVWWVQDRAPHQAVSAPLAPCASGASTTVVRIIKPPGSSFSSLLTSTSITWPSDRRQSAFCHPVRPVSNRRWQCACHDGSSAQNVPADRPTS
jgi:ABC-2 type transport system permease protein